MSTSKKKKTASKKKSTQSTVDLTKLTAEIKNTVLEELTEQFEQKLNSAVSTLRQTSEAQQNRIAMSKGEHKYSVTADEDGLQFCRGDNTVLLIGKNGQLGVGTRAPRSHGKGSTHIRAGGASEATLPTSGDFSTRGLIVEGDGDDDLSFSLRAVSRMNRQGFNVFSDGAVSIGSMQKINNASFSVYHRDPENVGGMIHSPSRNFDSTLLQLTSISPQSGHWNAMEVVSESNDASTVTHRVSGQGDVFANGTYYSNPTGYAEMFEWADGNHRGEDRTGFTVAINAEGELVVANEGDAVVGVVVPHAALVANSQWNHWKNKYFQDQFGRKTQGKYHVVEWLETETTQLKSHFAHSLPSTFALPENAVITETDADGNDLSTSMINSAHQTQQEYQGRHQRSSWAAVCLLGTVPVYKGQTVGKSWIKIKSISDELDLMLIR
jgi:hypothetical protein